MGVPNSTTVVILYIKLFNCLRSSLFSLCNWAMQAASACQPLLNLLQDEVQSGSFINIDETTLQVLKEPGRDPTSKSYMWLFRRGDPKKPVLIYQYQPTRSGDVARAFLRDFQGYVQTGGYSGYNFLDHDENIRHLGCWAHARRGRRRVHCCTA